MTAKHRKSWATPKYETAPKKKKNSRHAKEAKEAQEEYKRLTKKAAEKQKKAERKKKKKEEEKKAKRLAEEKEKKKAKRLAEEKKQRRAKEEQQRKEERKRLATEEINKYMRQGATLKDNSGGGDCLCKAFSIRLFGTEDRHDEIQEMICDELSMHQEILHDFDEHGSHADEYIQRARQPGEWMGEPEIQAFVEAVGCSLLLIDPDGNTPVPYLYESPAQGSSMGFDGFDGEPVKIVHEGNHFQLLITNDDEKVYPITKRGKEPSDEESSDEESSDEESSDEESSKEEWSEEESSEEEWSEEESSEEESSEEE